MYKVTWQHQGTVHEFTCSTKTVARAHYDDLIDRGRAPVSLYEDGALLRSWDGTCKGAHYERQASQINAYGHTLCKACGQMVNTDVKDGRWVVAAHLAPAAITSVKEG